MSDMIEVLQKLRAEFVRAPTQGYAVQDWQLAQWVRWIDDLKEFETPAERDLRLYHASPGGLTDEELEALDVVSPGAKTRELKRREQREREAVCPGHEAEADPVDYNSQMRGWHPAHCKHCGKDMSVDSGDLE